MSKEDTGPITVENFVGANSNKRLDLIESCDENRQGEKKNNRFNHSELYSIESCSNLMDALIKLLEKSLRLEGHFTSMNIEEDIPVGLQIDTKKIYVNNMVAYQCLGV